LRGTTGITPPVFFIPDSQLQKIAMDLSNPKIEISNQLWERCCGRVAQYELHIASEKSAVVTPTTYLASIWNSKGKGQLPTPISSLIRIL